MRYLLPAVLLVITLAFARVGHGQARHATYLPLAARDALPTATPAAARTTCHVSDVVDGDTIDVTGCADTGRVRLILVDTPEVFGSAECYGREASDYTRGRLPVGTSVALERDVSNADRFGRLLRYVYLDGHLFNRELAAQGYAVLAVFPPDTRYQDTIAAAEQEARAANRGLWDACGGADTPATPTPVGPAAPTASPTVADPVATSTAPAPTATPIPSGRPIGSRTGQPVLYDPSGPDRDCGDFSTWAQAQDFYEAAGGRGSDRHRLDSDRDAIACESLPGAP